jgi:hypothetical protein
MQGMESSLALMASTSGTRPQHFALSEDPIYSDVRSRFAVFARFSDLIASQIGTTPYKSRLILYYGSNRLRTVRPV